MSVEPVIVVKCVPCEMTFISRASYSPHRCPFCRVLVEPSSRAEMVDPDVVPPDSFFYRVFRRLGLIK